MTTNAAPLDLAQCERESLWQLLDVVDEFQRAMDNRQRVRAMEGLFYGLAQLRGLTEDTHWKTIAEQVRRTTSPRFLRDLLTCGGEGKAHG